VILDDQNDFPLEEQDAIVLIMGIKAFEEIDVVIDTGAKRDGGKRRGRQRKGCKRTVGKTRSSRIFS